MHAYAEPMVSPKHSSADALLPAVEARMLELVTAGAASSPAAAYHLSTGGQRIRARLALDAGLALGMPAQDAVAIAAAAELLHNASLVHDDLQDRDITRRDRPTVWAKYGEALAICAGDLLLCAAYGALASFTQVQHLQLMMSLLYRRCAATIEGQCADINSRDHAIDNMSVYEQVVIAKSGALLSVPLELALIGSGRSHACASARHATDAFAIGYQILDDLSDFASDSGQQGKPLALNAVRVLQGAGSKYECGRTAAQQLSLQHLRTAARAACGLPNGAGTLLSELALQLASTVPASRH